MTQGDVMAKYVELRRHTDNEADVLTPEGVRAAVGFVVAVEVLWAAGRVRWAEGVTAAGAGAHIGAVGEAFDQSPGEADRHRRALATAEQRHRRAAQVVCSQVVEPAA